MKARSNTSRILIGKYKYISNVKALWGLKPMLNLAPYEWESLIINENLARLKMKNGFVTLTKHRVMEMSLQL